MTLSFMTKFPDGTPTYFKEKILLSMHYCTDIHVDPLLGSVAPLNIQPKFHTFRKGYRWKSGIPIDFKQWSGLPYKSKTITFAPRILCTGQQKIFIQSPTLCLKSRIFIDAKPLPDNKIWQLAVNDGFNDEKHMFDYFKEHFEGQIVHWTNTRY